ncbi:HutD family protein [Pseudolabrys sp. FHR47]|uniref:HutD/Ves family protein n=1 Tax=Pseudolabrys sp. FHR47 TaxID=2562284 RepID=UPI0010BECEEB|nr:HutD family protein [Pseudolabrys sp. FHR47]
MTITPFAVADLAPSPWKNGGGETREIVCQPAGAGADAFGWRASIATIARDGAFSIFPDVDRVTVLLRGAGVRLRSTDGLIDHRLDAPLTPFAFAGEVEIDAELLEGACQDLNVMTRRDGWRSEVRVVRHEQNLAASDQGLLLAVDGDWRAEGVAQNFQLTSGSGLWWQGQTRCWSLQPSDNQAALLAVVIDAVDREVGLA